LPIVFHENAFRLLSEGYARSLLTTTEEPNASDAAEGASPEGSTDQQRVNVLARCLRPFAIVARKTARWGLRLFPASVSEELRLMLIHARQAFRNLAYRPARRLTAPFDPQREADDILDLSLVVHPTARDVLFVCGLSWDVLNWPTIAELRQDTGLRIVSVMYDLIPIKFPEFVGGPQPVLQNCFLHMVDNSDLIFCISACTETDFAEFVRSNGRPAVPTEIIYLGANVPALPSPESIPGASVRARLSSGRFALTVGTFEIRKNYVLLVDLWEDLLNDPEFDLDLVIVGMPGWLVEDTVKRLQALPGFGTRIHWFQRLSDSGLSWLYENCHVFLFPSLYEGWGLPVAEALLHKSPTIASDRGATPEAAFGEAFLIDPEDKAAWRRALVETAKAPRRVIEFDPSNLPTWERTAAAVAHTLMNVAAAAEPRA
jgi:glycosyltransferase involved in cell wall biosynthesis